MWRKKEQQLIFHSQSIHTSASHRFLSFHSVARQKIHERTISLATVSTISQKEKASVHNIVFYFCRQNKPNKKHGLYNKIWDVVFCTNKNNIQPSLIEAYEKQNLICKCGKIFWHIFSGNLETKNYANFLISSLILLSIFLTYLKRTTF